MDTDFVPTPENVRASLSDTSKEQYDFLLQELRNYGWSGNFPSPRGNSFKPEIPTKYGANIRFLIGLSDSTSKSRDKRGFKCDIDLKDFIDKREHEIAVDLANKLRAEAGYRGKGEGRQFGQEKLSQNSIDKWDHKLTHRPQHGWDDFTGTNADFEQLKNMLKIIKDIF